MRREAAAAVIGSVALALLIAAFAALWRAYRWWRTAKTKRQTNLKILEDIEMEFATEDDDELL